MKKKLTVTLIVGFVSLISGLILTGIGFFSGGFQKIITLSSAEVVHKTYENIESIDLENYYYDIQITPSDDNLFHVTYGVSKNGLTPSIHLAEKDGSLSLSTQERRIAIKGIMQFLGEQVSQRFTDNYYSSISIKVPKGKALKKLSSRTAWTSPVSIEDLTIEEVQLESLLYLKGVTIGKGKMDVAGFSHTIYDSRLKNVVISGEQYSIHLNNAILEQVQITGYQNLESKQLTLIGDNQFTPTKYQPLNVTNLDLSDQTLESLNLQISNSFDLLSLAQELGYQYESKEELEASDAMSYVEEQAQHVGIFATDQYKNLPIKTEGNKHTLIVEKKESKNKLSIETQNDTINFVKASTRK